MGVVAVCLLAALAPGAADVRVIELDEALRAAENAPDVVAARANERAAASRLKLARTPGEPVLTLGTHTITARHSVALSVPFRWGGQRASAVGAARADNAAAASAREVALANARRAVTAAWYTLAAGEDKLRAATEQAARADRNKGAVEALLEVERGSKLDAARATSEAASAAAAVAAAEQERLAAEAELAVLLGSDATHLSTGTARPTPPEENMLESWLARALASSPLLALAEAELRTAEAVVAQRSRDRLPSVTLEAGADWNDPTQPGTDAMAGLGIRFPTHATAALDIARAEHDRALVMLDLARRRVTADVATAWASAHAARLRFVAIDGTARPAAAQAAEMTRLGYREGRLDLFRLLDAERALSEDERDRADAYRDWGVAYADLTRLAPKEES